MSAFASDTLALDDVRRRYGCLVSLSLPCPHVSPASFLRHARGGPRFFWSSGREGLRFAGMGVALEIVAWGAERFATVEQHARAVFADTQVLGEATPLAAPRLFGGFAFGPETANDLAWADFPPAHFVLPHYQLTWIGSDAWLTLNIHVPQGDDHDTPAALYEAVRSKIAELQYTEHSPSAPVVLEQIRYPLAPAEWAHAIDEVRRRIRGGELKKVVLARFAEALFSGLANVDSALARLEHAYPETYRFLFEPRPSCAFFGATPELLADVHGDTISTMALAGSVRRGADAGEDAALAQQLLDSAKDRDEHQIVVDAIRARLMALTEHLDVGDTGVMTLSNIHHLHTPIRGRLSSQSGVLTIVGALHPTPALGGEPRQHALALIEQLEPFPRGWYAAPIGWIDHRLDGQFGIAIRSAVAQQRRVWLYAGAGIVADSDPQHEWDETALKFRPLLDALAIV